MLKFGGRFLGLWFLLVLSACATVAPKPEMGGTQHFAFYQMNPVGLFEGLSNYCDTPARRLERIGPGNIRCHQFLDPEATAGLILAHSGIVSDLPTLIGSILMAPGKLDQQSGFVVTFETYINVPQKSGPPVKVFQNSPAITRAFRTMLRATGGVAIPAIE